MLIAAASLAAGCRREPLPATGPGQSQPAGGPANGAAAPVEAPAAGQPTSPAANPSPSPEPSVTLRVVDKDGLSAVLERHRGKVVLVDFWATWCAPCVALLPHTIELGRKFGARGLVVVAVSIDDAADEAAVRETLAESGASGEQYLASYGVGPAAFEAFGIDDGALPHLKLYDREGRLHRAISSGGKPLDKAAIDRAVAKVSEVLDTTDPRLKIEIDDETKRVVVKIVQEDSGEVIRQIPPEELLKLEKYLASGKGMLLKEQA